MTMTSRSHCHLPLVFWLCVISTIQGATTHIKVLNGDGRGRAEYNPKFKVTAETNAEDKEGWLDENSTCDLDAAPAEIKSLSWIYQGPPHTFVLSPARISGPFGNSNLTLFKFEKPEGLKVNATTRIMTKMRSRSRIPAPGMAA